MQENHQGEAAIREARDKEGDFVGNVQGILENLHTLSHTHTHTYILIYKKEEEYKTDVRRIFMQSSSHLTHSNSPLILYSTTSLSAAF